MELQQSRRSFLTKTVELASAVPLVGLIVKNFANRTSYHEIDGVGAQVLETFHPALDTIVTSNASIGKLLDNLGASYEAAYYKSHVRMVPYTYRVGKITMMGMRPETYHTWEEPANVPKHDVIDGWRDFHTNFSNRIGELSKEATIDLDKLGELTVARRRTGTGREGLASLAIYTPQIAALLFYEEAIARMKHWDEEHSSAQELVDKHDTQPQITRRSFFKVGAALAGATASLPIVLRNQQRIEKGKTRLEGEIQKMRDLRNVPENQIFSQYFGIGNAQLIGGYREQLEISEQTLRANVEDAGVRSAFNEFIEGGNRAVGSVDFLIGAKVPEEIGDLIKSTLIARSLRDKSLSEHRAVYTSLGLTGLAVGGAIAATLAPLEVANEYFANRFEKSKSGFQ